MRREWMYLVGGLVLGAVAAWAATSGAHGAESAPEGLVDGRYLVIQNENGHWVYERTADGFKTAIKELSADGLSAIWKLQADYIPRAIETADGPFILVPSTEYSTDTGAFRVRHSFYRFSEGKLVEVEMTSTPESTD